MLHCRAKIKKKGPENENCLTSNTSTVSKLLQVITGRPALPGSPCKPVSPGGPSDPGYPLNPVSPGKPMGPCKIHQKNTRFTSCDIIAFFMAVRPTGGPVSEL